MEDVNVIEGCVYPTKSGQLQQSTQITSTK